MPYQGSNPRYPVRGGARESSSTRYSPYGKSSTERRPLRGEASFYGGYEGGSNDLSTSTGRYNNNSSSGAADYRVSHRSPSSTGRYPSSRGYYDRDTDAAGGHLDDRSYGNRYEDEDESEYSFSIRGRGRGRGGRGRGDGRGRGTIRGRGAHRGRGRGGYGHDFGGRSSDEFYGYTRAPPRHAEFGSYNDEGSNWAEEYTPAVQDTNMRSAEASYGSRNGQGYDGHHRQQSEYGGRRGTPNDSSMGFGGFRRPSRPSFDNEQQSSYANEAGFRRPMSQASSYSQVQPPQSKGTGGATESPGCYKTEIPLAPKKCTVRRTVFMRLPYTVASVHSSAIRSRLAEFGEIADMLDLHSKHVCYVMYYDSRDAANAISVLSNNFYIGDAQVNLVGSRHRPDAFNRNPMKTDYQATVLVSLVGANRGFEESDRAHFERFGEVCRFYPYFNSETEWVVEYYDCRSAKDAALNCHGQPACKGTMYTTFLWDDSVPRIEPGLAPSSRARQIEASGDARVDTRADTTRAFDKAAPRSSGAHVAARESRQSDDPYRARERVQPPSLQMRLPPALSTAIAAANASGDSNSISNSIRSASIAQPPQPASAPASSTPAAVPVPGAKKRPSAAKWMDSAVSSASSRSGSMDAARSSARQTTTSQEPPRVREEESTATAAASASAAASKMDSVISRFAQDPSVMQKAQAAREILQQHQSLLGLRLPATVKASSAPSVARPPMSAPAGGATMSMSGASAVSALNQLVSRAPRYDSQSTMVADISPLIPSKDMAKTLSGLHDNPPSVFDLAKSANAAESAVHSAIATAPTSMTSSSSLGFMDVDMATLSPSFTTAVSTDMPKQSYYQQQQQQQQEYQMPTSLGNHEDGINHLLGILAQVQKSAAASAAASETLKKH